MDPLQPLYELFDELTVQKKPPLQDQSMPVETPLTPPEDHPVTQQKKEVDSYRKQGMNPVQSHQQVYGEVDTGDVESKAQLATTLGRVQNEKDKRGVRPDKNGESLLSQETNKEEEEGVTDMKLQTPKSQELSQTEEYDYNDDVQYLRTYGRA